MSIVPVAERKGIFMKLIEQLFLGSDVFVHAAVVIEMIPAEVGENGSPQTNA